MKRSLTRRWLGLFGTVIWLCLNTMPCHAQQAPPPLRVAAAADLTRAFTEVADAYRKRYGQEVKLVFASSGQLAQQIENGAPYDLFAAANEEYVAQLDRSGLLLPGTRQIYGIGHLVIWTRSDGPPLPRKIEDLRDPRYSRIAIANPDHAPYGTAAREALQNAQIWDALKPRLVYGENIQATYQFAATGNADVALVSLAQARGSKEGRCREVPAKLYRPLRQAMAALKSGTQPDNERRFLAFVRRGEGAGILRHYGFTVPK
jgi:molybdate transport system substrate-binding protein